MTHDELLAKIDQQKDNAIEGFVFSDVFDALRAVVELHPIEQVGNSWVDEQSGRYGVSIYMCKKCKVPYPCEEIQAIEERLK